MLEVFRVDAHPLVHDPNDDLVAVRLDATSNATAEIGELAGVVKQVAQDLSSTARTRWLLFRQQQLSRLAEAVLETAGDQAEDTGQMDLHAHRGLEDIDDAGDDLPERASEPRFALRCVMQAVEQSVAAMVGSNG